MSQVRQRHNWRRLTAIVLCAVLLALLAAGLASLAGAAGPLAVLRPDPLSLGLRPGEQGAMTLRGDNVQAMYGLEFHLSFDPAVVQVVDMDPDKPGVQVKPGDWLKEGFVAVNRADNAAGTVDYAATLLNPAPPVSGQGIVAIITFVAKANGASPVRFTKAILASREALEIPSESQDGAIGVSAQAVAPTVQVTTSSTPSGAPAGAGAAPAAAQSSQTVLIVAAVAGVGVFLVALILVLVAARRRRP